MVLGASVSALVILALQSRLTHSHSLLQVLPYGMLLGGADDQASELYEQSIERNARSVSDATVQRVISCPSRCQLMVQSGRDVQASARRIITTNGVHLPLPAPADRAFARSIATGSAGVFSHASTDDTADMIVAALALHRWPAPWPCARLQVSSP